MIFNPSLFTISCKANNFRSLLVTSAMSCLWAMTLSMPTPICFLNLDVCDSKHRGLGGQSCFTKEEFGVFSLFEHSLSPSEHFLDEFRFTRRYQLSRWANQLWLLHNSKRWMSQITDPQSRRYPTPTAANCQSLQTVWKQVMYGVIFLLNTPPDTVVCGSGTSWSRDAMSVCISLDRLFFLVFLQPKHFSNHSVLWK